MKKKLKKKVNEQFEERIVSLKPLNKLLELHSKEIGIKLEGLKMGEYYLRGSIGFDPEGIEHFNGLLNNYFFLGAFIAKKYPELFSVKSKVDFEKMQKVEEKAVSDVQSVLNRKNMSYCG